MTEYEQRYDAVNGFLFGCCLVLIVILILALLGELELTEIPAWLMDMGV